MKVLHINTYDRGGAANACIRLHLGLLDAGIDSHLLLLHKTENKNIPNCSVFEKSEPRKKTFLERAYSKIVGCQSKEEKIKATIQGLIPGTLEWFSFPDTGIDITTNVLYQEADIINLHWISGFVDYSFFEKNKKPLFWTLHDMNAFTGGCHYSFNCGGFQTSCIECPQLEKTSNNSYSKEILNYKKGYLDSNSEVNVISPSSWLNQEAKKSSLLKDKRSFVIPYGINSEIFQPRDKKYSKKLLGLPEDKKVVLFVSFFLLSNKRKGFEYLIKSLESVGDLSEEAVLCVVGGNSHLTNSLFKIFENSNVRDERLMSVFYSACDLFVIPSLEDNLPNTVIESLMCGTPIVGFSIGGIKDMVTDGENGYLASEVTPEALAAAIRNFFENPAVFDRQEIRANAVKKYDSSVQANAYIALYNEFVK